MMRKTILIASFMLAATLLSCAPDSGRLQSLAGPWEYAPGSLDDGYDRARGYQYRPLPSLMGLERLVPGGRGILWVRTRIAVPAQSAGEERSLLIGAVMPADQAYVDGRFVGGLGNIPEGGRRFFSDWNRPRLYHLPRPPVGAAGQELSLRIYVNYEGAIIGPVLVGDREAAEIRFRLEDLASGAHLFLAFLMLFITGYVALIYLKRPRERQHLYYGLTVLFVAIFETNFFVTRLPVDAPRYLSYFTFQKIVYAAACLGFLFLMWFIHEFYRRRAGWAVKALFFLACAVPAGVLLVLPDYRTMVHHGKLLPAVAAGVSLSYLLGLTVVTALRGNRNALTILAGLVVFIAAVVFDIVQHVLYDRTDAPYLAVAGFTVFIISITFILANDFVNARNRVESLADDLAHQIERQRLAENALSAEKERLAVTLSSIADGVIATDTEGRVVTLNGIAEDLSGVPRDRARGMAIDTVLCGGDPKRDHARGVFAAVRGAEHGGEFSYEHPGPDRGSSRFIAGNGAPIRTGDGAIRGYVFVIRDISEDLKLQNEILKARKLESIGVLAGGIAHDFNNMLMSIVGNINLAKLIRPDDGEVGEILGAAEDACMRAKGLTQQLLTFSRGGAPVRKITSVEHIVKDSAAFVLRGTNVQSEYRVPAPPWPVNADAGQLSQVIQNLVINAIQAMPGGGHLTVGVENMHLAGGHDLPLPDGDYVRISVADTGVGIPPEHLPQIFDPYYTTKEEGSGLGLASVYAIVRKHEGHVGVESTVDRGTTFRIWLPAVVGVATDGDTEPYRITPLSGRVLVMDDDRDVLKIIASMLEGMGLAVAVAAEGAAAVETYAAARDAGRPFDAVILDLTMPGGMGGLEVLARLRAIDPAVRAIVSSGYSNNPVMADYATHGFAGVIGKPFRSEELHAELARVLGRE